MRRIAAIAVISALVLLPMWAAGADKKVGYIDYEMYQLPNGLRVILSEDRSAPVVAVNVWYHVGSAYEEEGRSGFAHLFEHMMFQGSENVGKAEHFQYVQRAGGNNNGSTTQDRTNYFEVLPANRLNLALWLEADRMRTLAITTENFENQRSTVKEERRQRIDNQPYGAAFLTSDTLSYDFKPYRHTVIGKMEDLDAAKVEDVQAFFDRYYSPNNAVLVVVGDIDKKKTKKWIEQYFGRIEKGPEVRPISGDEPLNKGERRATLEDKNANVPAVFICYNTPPITHEDTPAFELLGKILTDGEASRLHQRLVKKEEVAVVVWGGADARKGPSLFRFVAASNVGAKIEDCERLIYEEIDKLQKEGIDPKELEKAKIQYRSDFVEGRQTVLGKAEELQTAVYFYGDASRVNTEIDRIMAVTSDDIKRVANKYFGKDNRTVVVANPASKSSS